MYTIALTTALLAGLSAAQPTAKATVNIQVGLEVVGDASTIRTIPFKKLAKGVFPSASSLVVGSSDNVPIEQDEIVCQAFSDRKGTKELGPTFDNVIPGISLVTAGQLVDVASVYCSDAAGVAAFVARFDAPKAAPPTGSVSEVNIKLDFDAASAGASVISVPVNGQLVLVTGTGVANKASIQSSNGQQPSDVNCEAFGDEAGTQKIGDVSGNGEETVFGQGSEDVPIGAFKCSA